MTSPDRIDGIRQAVDYMHGLLRQALGDTAPERDFVAPGASVAWDAAEQMWVRLVEWYPSTDGIGVQDSRPRGARGPLRYSVTIELGVLRCSPVLGIEDNQILLPEADALTANAGQILDDAAAMRLACTDLVDDSLRRNVLMGAWTALGPEGGAAGGTLLVTIDRVKCSASSGDV